MEDIVVTNTTTDYTETSNSSLEERKAMPYKEQISLKKFPRCNSTNTKFCYYKNYSLSQPRFFCKTCRRYWTEGGSLRNIPVGGSRKNKRSANTSSSTVQRNPNSKIHENNSHQDLNLGFATSNPDRSFKSLAEMIHDSSFGNKEENNMVQNLFSASSNVLALELLTGLTGSRCLSDSFIPLKISCNNTSESISTTHDQYHYQHHHHQQQQPNSIYSTGSLLTARDQFRPSLNFTLHGIGGNDFGIFRGVQENANGKILLPVEDVKVSSDTKDDAGQQENRDQHGESSTGFWIDEVMGGGGGSW